MYNHEISIDITPDLAPMHGRRDTDVPAPKLSGGGEQLQIFSLTTINLESVRAIHCCSEDHLVETL